MNTVQLFFECDGVQHPLPMQSEKYFTPTDHMAELVEPP